MNAHSVLFCHETNFRERFAVVVPKRLRELFYCQRSKAKIKQSLYCTVAFTKTQSIRIGNDMKCPLERVYIKTR